MEVAMRNEQLRSTGIGVVGEVPWGTHFFLFHETAEDLLDACIPYFQAGLESGELCIWAIGDPLTEDEVRYCLKDAIPHFDDYFDRGSIEIVRGREWYMTGNELDLKRVTSGWKQKMERALNGGHTGLRLSADTAWLDKRDWKEFCEYEKEVNDSIVDTQMLALCSYPLPGSAAAEIFDVARTHQFAIARRNKGWEVVETSELKHAKAEIQRLNNDLEHRVAERTRELTAANEELRRQMTERLRAEDALRSSQAELARVMRVTSMGEMAASIAHEVTQPLTGIITNGNTCLNWLASAPPNIEKARATVERIIRDSSLASDVIQNVRTLVKKTPPQRMPVGLNDVIRRTLALVSGEIARYQVYLQTELAADLPDVPGDPVQLQQVLLNLIINAMEAMSTIDGRARVLTVRSEHRKDLDAVAITVQDSGVGLDSVAERMFDAFFTTKPEGMGMGLSICRSIISAHGGHLSNANNSDYGASFEFTLPACAAARPRAETATA
jgi:C4-dicarboxylate-specific signal transduction histidine kinase